MQLKGEDVIEIIEEMTKKDRIYRERSERVEKIQIMNMPVGMILGMFQQSKNQ